MVLSEEWWDDCTGLVKVNTVCSEEVFTKLMVVTDYFWQLMVAIWCAYFNDLWAGARVC